MSKRIVQAIGLFTILGVLAIGGLRHSWREYRGKLAN